MADNDKEKALKAKDKKPRGEKRHFRRIRETFAELKKVTWPTFGNVAKTTALVLGMVGIFLLVVLAFDLILSNFAYKPLTGGGFPWSRAFGDVKGHISGLIKPIGINNIWRF